MTHQADGRKAQAVKWVANNKNEAEILVLHPDGSTSVELLIDWVPDVIEPEAIAELRSVLNENFYKI